MVEIYWRIYVLLSKHQQMKKKIYQTEDKEQEKEPPKFKE